MSMKPRCCPGCNRPTDEASAWCNFCGRHTSGRPARGTSGRTGLDASCTPKDLAGIEAALSSQDPAVVARALTARVAAARGGRPLLPASSRLVIDRHSLHMTPAGSALVEATLLGAARGRWRLHLDCEGGRWRVARMERALSKSA